MKVYTFEQVNTNELQFSKPKQNSMGGQHIFMNISNCNQNDSKVCIQTSKCKVPFGLNEFKGRYTLDLQVQNKSEMKEFAEKLNSTVIKAATENSFSWFKKSLHESVIKELFKPQLKQNGEYPPLMRVKMPFKNGRFDGKIYNEKNEEISHDEITKGCEVQAIIENTGVYFVSSEFGLSWKVSQLKVFPSEKLQGYAFIDE
jgi:hypothetical protein